MSVTGFKSEKDMEDYLWDNPGVVDVGSWAARQFRICSGIIDLIGWNVGRDELYVFELKNIPVEATALTQVSRYVSEIRALMENSGVPYDDLRYIVTPVVIGGPPADKMIAVEARALGISLKTIRAELGVRVEKVSADNSRWLGYYDVLRSEVITGISETLKGAGYTQAPTEIDPESGSHDRGN